MYDLVAGLTALQHRGQDSAGVVTFEDVSCQKRVRIGRKRFPRKNLERLRGNIEIGITRYTTQGTNELVNVQPFAVNYPFGLCNGA